MRHKSANLLQGMIGCVILIAALSPVTTVAGEFVLRADCLKPDQQLCLLQNIPINATVVLLGADRPETCVTKGIDRVEVPREVGRGIVLTVLDNKPCPNFKFTIAYIGVNPSVRDYRPQSLAKVTNLRIVQKIDKAIREHSERFEAQGGEHPTLLPKEDYPAVYAVPGEDDQYIAIYENAAPARDQIHVLYSKGNVHSIVGAAKMVSAFRMNETLFIHYKFSCHIGCGWMGDFIFAITGRGVERVLFDDSWSA